MDFVLFTYKFNKKKRPLCANTESGLVVPTKGTVIKCPMLL